jgi:hypothetical protein
MKRLSCNQEHDCLPFEMKKVFEVALLTTAVQK